MDELHNRNVFRLVTWYARDTVKITQYSGRRFSRVHSYMDPDQIHSRETDMDTEWTKLKTTKRITFHSSFKIKLLQNKERHGINPWK